MIEMREALCRLLAAVERLHSAPAVVRELCVAGLAIPLNEGMDIAGRALSDNVEADAVCMVAFEAGARGY